MIRPKEKFQIYWWLLALVMSILLGLVLLLLHNHKNEQSLQALSYQNKELKVLSILAEQSLRGGEYENIQNLFEQWLETHNNVSELTLESQTGFIIAQALREKPDKHEQYTMQWIDYGYDGRAKITMGHNISSLNRQNQKLAIQLLIMWTITGLVAILLILHLKKRHRETRRLSNISNKLLETNKQLVNEQSLQHSLINSIPDPIFFKDTNGNYLGCNRAFENFSGYREQQIIDQSDNSLFDENSAHLFHSNDLDILESGSATRSEQWVTYPDGAKVLLDTLKTPFFDPKGNVLGVIGISRDITKIKKYQTQLEDLAYHDSLTHLPNRRFLIDRMLQAISSAYRTGKKLAVCALDLDGFKPVNDSLGHAAGDKLLIDFAQRMTNALRIEDTVARWGGDEFSLLFTNIEHDHEIIELIERLQNLIALPYSINGKEFSLTASIGLTVYPDDNSDTDTLLRHADQAMYNAKLNGKNQYHFFDTEQDKLIHDQRQILGNIESAIYNDEMVLHFQPQIHLRQGAPYGVEALVRWQHPEKGLLLPGKFLPLIEDHPLSIELDWWVMKQALKQQAQWVDQGGFFHLSINISSITFQQADFVERLQKLLDNYESIYAEMISLEIIETAALGNLEQIAEKMLECQKLGVTFALDDFGTGYSSLTYLSRLPADVLKIDSSFVRDMLTDERDANIVEGIVRLASAFKRLVIAEGVEEIGHGKMLIEMGCKYAQGYAIAKPMPGEELLEWLNHYKPPREWLDYPE